MSAELPRKKCVFVGRSIQKIIFYSQMFVKLEGKVTISGSSDSTPKVMNNFSTDTIFEGKEFRLDMWDASSGQKEYDRSRLLLYPDTNVFVVCFSIVESGSYQNVIEKWIPELHRHCPNVPIILCAIDFKSGLEHMITSNQTITTSDELRRRYNCVAFLQYSIDSAKAVNELLELIKEVALFPNRFVIKDDDNNNKKESTRRIILGKLKSAFQFPTAFYSSPPLLIQERPQSDTTANSNQLDKSQGTTTTSPVGGAELSPPPIVKEEQVPVVVVSSRNLSEISFDCWSVDEVGKWLQSKGCHQTVIDILKENGFSGAALIDCEIQYLTQLGIKIGNVLAIMKWIKPYKESIYKPSKSSSPNNSSSTPTPVLLEKQIGSSGSSNESSFYSPSTMSSFVHIDDNFEQESEPTTGNELDKRYSIIETLGEGGFGKVIKVLNKRNKQIRAVKIISPTKDFSVNQALKEAMGQAQLFRSDNHIVHVYEAFIAQESGRQIVCIEMDCMEGSLRSIFKGKKASQAMVISTLNQMGIALKFLSENGNIVHRDIKPDNILVKKVDFETNEIEVYLSDFGLAKSTLNSIQTSHLSGTFFFHAPEILDFSLNSHGDNGGRNRSPYSMASDIFALGVSMYQIMTHDTTSNLATLCSKGKSGVELIKGNIPQDEYNEELVGLILEMLNKEPTQRPSIDSIINILNHQ